MKDIRLDDCVKFEGYGQVVRIERAPFDNHISVRLRSSLKSEKPSEFLIDIPIEYITEVFEQDVQSFKNPTV